MREVTVEEGTEMPRCQRKMTDGTRQKQSQHPHRWKWGTSLRVPCYQIEEAGGDLVLLGMF